MKRALFLLIVIVFVAFFTLSCGQQASTNSSSNSDPIPNSNTSSDGITTIVTPDATYVLSSVTLSLGTLTPTFSSTVSSYAVTVSNSVSSIIITPTVSGTDGTIAVDGKPASSGTASAAISLSVGTKSIPIIVTPTNGSSISYTIAISRQADTSSVSDYVLSGISLSSGTLSPSFDSSITSYAVSVANSVGSITVTPSAVGSGGTITVNGETVSSGSSSSGISLTVGSNTITIVVTKADSTTKTFTITVTRAGSFTLSDLSLSSGTLSQTFNSATLSYSASVANSVSSVTVTPTVNSGSGAITVNSESVSSGNASSAISLAVGLNTITIIVTPSGGNATTYTIAVTRASAGVIGGISPPSSPVKLIFVHHSIGENWLADGDGKLALELMSNNYFVSDTNYYWGPTGSLSLGIGTYTDIGYWHNWFRGADSSTYLSALYLENQQNYLYGYAIYSRLVTEPAGNNEIIMFKSGHLCSNLKGTTDEVVPAIGSNPLVSRYQDEGNYHTVANAKGIYIDLLNYFQAHQEKLFIVITAPPVTDGTYADNIRYFNSWLVNDWLDSYAYDNVAVFDFYNVLTHPDNHHRIVNGVPSHEINNSQNTSYYPGGVGGGDHINTAGGQKATSEFVPLLNYFYNRWQGN